MYFTKYPKVTGSHSIDLCDFVPLGLLINRAKAFGGTLTAMELHASTTNKSDSKCGLQVANSRPYLGSTGPGDLSKSKPTADKQANA